jgi:hypothetical protein
MGFSQRGEVRRRSERRTLTDEGTSPGNSKSEYRNPKREKIFRYTGMKCVDKQS